MFLFSCPCDDFNIDCGKINEWSKKISLTFFLKFFIDFADEIFDKYIGK